MQPPVKLLLGLLLYSRHNTHAYAHTTLYRREPTKHRLMQLNPVSVLLDEIRHVHGHLLDLCAVELLDLAQSAHVVSREEVDRHTLTTEPASTADAVDVVLAVGGQVVVDHERDLLHVPM